MWSIYLSIIYWLLPNAHPPTKEQAQRKNIEPTNRTWGAAGGRGRGWEGPWDHPIRDADMGEWKTCAALHVWVWQQSCLQISVRKISLHEASVAPATIRDGDAFRRGLERMQTLGSVHTKIPKVGLKWPNCEWCEANCRRPAPGPPACFLQVVLYVANASLRLSMCVWERESTCVLVVLGAHVWL